MPGSMQGNANNLVPHANRFVPRPMLRRENISLVLRREFISLIERELQRSVVGLQQYIGHDRLILQLGMLARMPRILVRPQIPPRPSIKPAFLHMRDVVGHKVIAQRVALIHRAPQLPGLGIDLKRPARIANPGGIHLQLAIIGITPQNVG